MEFIIKSIKPSDWDKVRFIYQKCMNTGNATFETTFSSKSWFLGKIEGIWRDVILFERRSKRFH